MLFRDASAAFYYQAIPALRHFARPRRRRRRTPDACRRLPRLPRRPRRPQAIEPFAERHYIAPMIFRI